MTVELVTQLNEMLKCKDGVDRTKFGLQRKVLGAMARARLYGGAVIILGVDQGTFQEELKIDQIKKGDLKFLHVVERWMIAAGGRVRDTTSPWFGEPNYYMRANIPVVPAPDPRVTPAPEPEVDPGGVDGELRSGRPRDAQHGYVEHAVPER